MQYYPFDSRNKLYRNKIGALAEGETLRLRLLLHNDAKIHSAFLVIRDDSEENCCEALMTPCGYIEDYRIYECEVTLTEGLYWYCFRYTSDYGQFYVSKTESSLGIVKGDAEPTYWQQTVFEASYKTPDWLKGGIIYQIFPDRFNNSGEQKKNIPDDRFICDDWNATPEYRQPQGETKKLGNDYYGGDLKGIEQKLDYLKDLGVSCIYLNPIFEAHSNHRYNTADYFKVDCMLGTEKDLESLVSKAKLKGISIILDGVFSHTGDDSIYFNKYRRYGNSGAYNDKNCQYASWYNFNNSAIGYASWWGVPSLPETNENDISFSNFITGENGVIRYWLKKGIKGWRLDVADELPDLFLDKIRLAVKAESEDNFLLGEVWEDATNKISYGVRRRYLRGRQLDSVMNYPFANAIVDFLKGESADRLINTVLDICENYPKQSVDVLMNHIGTHDTARILTRLGDNSNFQGDREAQSKFSLSNEQYIKGIKLLKLAAVLQYTLPGVPSLYYGDEAGLTGHGDPFCRAAYPWGKENKELLAFYKELGQIRIKTEQFKEGDFTPINSPHGCICYSRSDNNGQVIIAVNRNDYPTTISLETTSKKTKVLLGGVVQENEINLSPFGYCVLQLCN